MEEVCGGFLFDFDIADTSMLQTAVITEPTKLHIMCVTPDVKEK